MKRFNKAALVALLGTTAMAGAQNALAQVDTSAVTDEIVVRGVNIPDEKRATSEISAVLDTEAFERTGDANIADALKRVTGLSLADDRFVIVRGLNERYSSATLNGNPLPSPEPLRRVAPLDLFPTSILSGSLVQKTFSPEYSAEFGGGAIDLRLKSIPDEAFFEVEGSLALDTVTTASDYLTYDGGGIDWLGFDDGTRSVPAELQPFFTDRQLAPGSLTEAEQNAIDLAIDNERTSVLFSQSAPPNWGVRASGGSRFYESDAVSLGFVATIGMSTDFVNRNGNRRRITGVNSDGTFDGGQGATFEIDSSQQNVDINGLLSIGAEIYDNHEINVSGLVLRSTTKEARIQTGTDADGNRVRGDFTEFFERQVFQFQSNGEHVFPTLANLGVNWRVAYGEATRDAPYERFFGFEDNNEDGIFRFDFDGQQADQSSLRFTRLDDENFGGGIDFVLPVVLGDNALDLKAGYAYTDKQRVTSDRFFRFEGDEAAAGALAESRVDVIFSDAVVGTDIIDLVQGGVGIGNPDNFVGNLEVHAAYTGADLELGPYLRLAAGVRYETSEQTTEAFITGNAPITGFPELDEDYFLPAVTVTWNPIDDVQVRGGFSQTIVRPQFREIGPVEFTNPNTDILTTGNALLVNSEINNFDVRAEYYFGREQYVTLGGFYKEITNPIEEITASGLGGGDAGRSTFVNSDSAEVYGFEFEFQKNFAIDEWFDGGWLGGWASTKELVFVSNYTFTQSDVTGGVAPVSLFNANGTLQEATFTVVSDRALQGQSDHLANVQIGYKDFEANSRATILFNYASERIMFLENGAPNNRVIENPPIFVDFVYNRVLDIANADYELEFAIRNILGDDYDTQQVTDVDSIVFDQYDIGRIFSISLKRSF
ncbi:MAG: TonB-dependent receptor [Pseudomonadota bacterium]